MLKKFVLLLVIVVVIFVAAGLLLPADYSMARTIKIDAPTARIHQFVGDLEQWDTWGPWKDDDPSLVVTRGETTQGVGASQTWVSKEGPGRLEFIKSVPSEGIAYDFEMGDSGKSVGAMSYRPLEGSEVEVTWSMTGTMDVPVLGPYFAMLMDQMVGPSFEKGLSNLKLVAEKE